MDSIGSSMQRLLVVCCSLALLGCRAEKLSADQKAPQFANSSAGASLALPRDDSPDIGESSPLGQLLAGLHIKASEQTPADTSLLESASRRTGGGGFNALQRFHIKAFGQTPADTSLLPRQQQQPNKSEPPASLQSRRAGQRGRQTPANVGLLRPAGPPSRPPSASGGPRPDGVQREEMTSFKELNGQSVRVVVGNYGYESPEGLPVSFKYMSDENGNQASFQIGTPGAGGGGGGLRPGASGAGGGGRGTGGGGAGKATAGGSKTGGATGGKGGDKYLPPK